MTPSPPRPALEAPPRDLTLPEGSIATARAVVSASLKRLLGDLGRLPLARASAPAAASLAEVLRATRGELGGEPGRVFGVLRRPNVGAAARVLRDLDAGAPRARVDELCWQLGATLGLELATAGATLPPLAFDRAPERVVCLGGRFVVAGGAATLTDGVWTSRGRSVDLAAPENVERPYTPIEGALVLATVDDNPISMFEAHPDKEGNAIDLGGRDEGAWCAALRDALQVIGEHLPLVREEIDLVVAQLVPVGVDDHAHLSASYREAIGTIYLTLHPRTMTMVEALIHEHGHNKLNALLEVDPVLDNAFHPLFTSPVRPDPRPLHGILLAVHAFLPVAVLYRAMIEAGAPSADHPDFRRRFAQIVKGNREGVRVLIENAAPTPIGRALLDEIAELDARFDDVDVA